MKNLIMFFVVPLTIIFGAAYLYFSDALLLNDGDCLEYAFDVLGDSAYGVSCPRSSYQPVENLNLLNTSGGAAIFIFRPAFGKETLCPSIKVLVDRQDATVSVTHIL